MYGTVWAFLVSVGHITLIKESSFGFETWLITQNLKPGKGCLIDILSSPINKENGSIVVNKDHHHHISVMELGHLLTRSGLMYPEASSKVYHGSFCQLGNVLSSILYCILSN
jgi:hypothetical protein